MEVKEMQQHLETIQQQDEDRKLSKTYCDTANNLKDAVTDLSNARVLSRALRTTNEELEFKLKELQRSINRSAFVLVLVDADTDGYVFDDKYLLRGTDGGREAAVALKLELQRELRQTSPDVAELPFILKLYANVDKLGGAMFRNGMHEASNLLRDFCRGFCQTGGLSEFIDVGDGKDRADHQIKGVLEHFKDNPCCKHIVLGGCHDNGYVCDLDIIKSEGSLRDRITLLKSFQTGRQYSDLPFNSIHLPSLFRTEAFSVSVPLYVAHSPPENTSRERTGSTGPGLSYAARAGSSDGPIVEPAPPSPTNSANRRVILVNAVGQRLDGLLRKPPQAAFAHYHSKKRELEATNGLCGSRAALRGFGADP
ncbi:hypothetical protein V500_01372 [Pseudogymnoascus sp. VKM F-4518 (FW-2643)]|nr:hypothetical protein V500_01372 [Pseudogymnoascus sp. VKM F-4518 (FW-2643)]